MTMDLVTLFGIYETETPALSVMNAVKKKL